MTYNSKGEEIFPSHPIHPGQMLADELEAWYMTQQQLAGLMGVSASSISELVRGKKSVSMSMALKLEAALEISAEFWLNAQRHYNQDTAYHKARRVLKRLNVTAAKQKALLKAVVGLSLPPLVSQF